MGGSDAAFGPAAVAVLALGHQQLGEKPGVGEPFAFGTDDGVGGLRPHGSQY